MDLFQFFNTFYPLQKAHFDLFASYLKPVSYKKGAYIIREGEVQKEVLFVKSGYQMSFINNEGKTHVIAFTYSPGPCCIPDSVLLQKPSDYFLQCITDSEFDTISFVDLNHLFDVVPPIERLFRKITETVLAGLIRRHVDLHVLSIEQRFKAFAARSPQLLHLLPHKYIASYLNIDRTNFSKLFNTIKI